MYMNFWAGERMHFESEMSEEHNKMLLIKAHLYLWMCYPAHYPLGYHVFCLQ